MAEDNKAPKQRPRRWRGSWVLRIFGLLTVVPLVFAVIAAVMMIDRDITAPSWVTERVQDRAALMLGGGSLSFGSISLNIGSDLHPRIRLNDTVLRDADGVTLAEISQVSGQVSPRGLVFERSALFQEVDLNGVRLTLTRNREGGLSLAFDTGASAATRPQSLPELIDAIDATFDRPVLAALEKVRMDAVTLIYNDVRSRRRWILDGGEAALDLRGDTRQLHATLALLAGPDVTTLDFAYASPVGSREATLALDLENARAADIATQSPAMGWLAVLDADVSAALWTSIDAEGQLGPLNAMLDLGQGALRPGDSGEAYGFDSARAELTYTPADQTITFDEVRVATDWGDFAASGQALGREFQGGLPQALIGQLAFRDMRLQPRGLYSEPVGIDAASVDLRLRLSPFVLDVGQVVVQRDDMTAVLKGRVTATGDGVASSFDLSVPDLESAEMMALWPESFRPGTRRWFARNVITAKMSDVAVGWRKAPGFDATVAASFLFDEAEVTYLQSHPPVRNAAGAVFLGQDRADVTLSAGQITAPQGGVVDMDGSHLAIPDMSVPESPMIFDLAMNSTITAGLSLLDLPPFSYLTRAGLPVTIADGRGQTEVALTIPRKEVLRGSDVDFRASSEMRGVRTGIVPGRILTSDRLSVEVERTGLEISGPAALDGVPLRGTFSRAFQDGAASEVAASVRLTPDALAVFGIGLPPGMVRGQGDAGLSLRIPPGGPPAFSVESALQGLTLAVPAIGWTKSANAPGSLALSGVLGQAPRIDSFALEGGGLAARGDIAFRDDGGFEALQLSSLRVGDWLNAPVVLRNRGAGLPVGVEVNGGILDLRRARFGGQSSSGTTGGPVNISLEQLTVAAGISLRDFSGQFDAQRGFSGQFVGRVNGGTMVRGAVAPANGRTAVRVQSSDAGGVIRSAGLSENTAGGQLDLILTPTGAEGTFDGSVSVRDGMRVRDAPTMAALLDAISVVGLLQQLDGQGLNFDEIDVAFRLTPNRLIVTQASAVGPGLGISLDGIYTLATQQLDFQGVVSPFYLVNAIGEIFTRRGEGLIGFNFTLRGSASVPQVGVNPLSALTPGMFRDIFRRPPPQVSQ